MIQATVSVACLDGQTPCGGVAAPARAGREIPATDVKVGHAFDDGFQMRRRQPHAVEHTEALKLRAHVARRKLGSRPDNRARGTRSISSTPYKT